MTAILNSSRRRAWGRASSCLRICSADARRRPRRRDLTAGALIAVLVRGLDGHRAGGLQARAATARLVPVGIAPSLLWGIAGCGGGPWWRPGSSEIIVGALVGGPRRLRRHALRHGTYAGASFYDRGGAPMVDVQSLRMKDGTILMKALAAAVHALDGLRARPRRSGRCSRWSPSTSIKQLPVVPRVKGYKACRSPTGDAAQGMEGDWRCRRNGRCDGRRQDVGLAGRPFASVSSLSHPLGSSAVLCGTCEPGGLRILRGAACATIAGKP